MRADGTIQKENVAGEENADFTPLIATARSAT